MSITLLLAFLACTSDKDVVSGEEGDADTDTDTDSDTDADCDAALEVDLPDATTIALGCTGATAEASFQFDPDAPPAVRSLGIRIGGGEPGAAACYLDFDLTGVCGVGWYAFDGAASGSVATLDCAGVADEVDRVYPLTAGSIYLSEVSGGEEPDAPGGPNDLRAVGTISARSSDGLLISGSFAIDQQVVAVAVEGGECLVEETDPGLADLDFDGWEGPAGTGEDCDDLDASVHPGAYDRPDDGVDTDCDGADRTFDGVVIDAGATTTTGLAYVTAEGVVGLDIALVLDTGCSMGGSIMTLDVPTIAAATTGAGDARWSFAAFHHYVSGRGSGGKPFALRAQISDDLRDVQAAIDATSTGSGSNDSEAGMEALYQALTGAGYDEDCDGAYDTTDDVYPFIASAGDPFAGAGGESYDYEVSGTGAGGGVGFRGHAQPVVVLITDNYLRDPEGVSLPGGCPGDADAAAVAEAAIEQDAWIVGILVNGTAAQNQFEYLSVATGQLVDSDGDGAVDDTPMWPSTGFDINTQIASALDAVAAVVDLSGTVYAEVEIVVGTDSYGIVQDVLPATFTDVAPGDSLAFDLDLRGVATEVALTTTISLLVYGDGELIDTIEVEVEIAPG